jgi:hypothetical protein
MEHSFGFGVTVMPCNSRAVGAGEIFPKAVDGRANSSGLSFAVDEHDAVDQVF